MVDAEEVVVDSCSLLVAALPPRIGKGILRDVLFEVFGAVHRLGGKGTVQQLDRARVLSLEE